MAMHNPPHPTQEAQRRFKGSDGSAVRSSSRGSDMRPPLMAIHNPLPIHKGLSKDLRNQTVIRAVSHPRGRWASKRLHRAW